MTVSEFNNQIIDLEDKLKNIEEKLNFLSESLTASQEKTKTIQKVFLNMPSHKENVEESGNL